MKNKNGLFILLISILFIFSACPFSADDESDWSDFDGDGITGFNDVDDIILPFPDTNIVTTLTPVLTIKPLNPDIVSRYWIQIFPYYDNYEEFLLFSKNDYTTNKCLVPADILYNGRFFWRAKAYDSINNRWSNTWSDVLDFIVQTDISSVSPTDNGETMDSTPLLDWKDFPGATGYHLQIGSNFDYPNENLKVDIDSLTESQYQIDYIIDNGYGERWRFRYLNSNGIWGEWSKEYYFNVNVKQPSIPNPKDNGFIRSPTSILDWEDVPGAENYMIRIWRDDESTIVSDTIISESQFQFNTRWNYSENYNWRVYSQNEDGIWGDGLITPATWQFGLEAVNFSARTSGDNDTPPYTAYTVDIDGDGDPDLLGSQYLGDNLIWWENDGEGNFTKHILDSSSPGGRSVYSTDLDDDGDMDFMVGAEGDAYSTDSLVWWENDSNQNFTKHVISTTFKAVCSIHAADFNGDGFIDILGSSGLDGEIGWWKNDGNENFSEYIISDGTRYWKTTEIYATDLDEDGYTDILGAVDGPCDVVWLENNGDETFTEHIIDSNFGDATNIHAADMDHDGDIDVIGVSKYGTNIAWWENNGTESFTKHLILDNIEASSLDVADLNMDNELDIIVTLSDTNDIIWFENDAAGGFIQRTINTSFYPLDSTCSADFDGDGDIDVFVPLWAVANNTWWENNVIQ